VESSNYIGNKYKKRKIMMKTENICEIGKYLVGLAFNGKS